MPTYKQWSVAWDEAVARSQRNNSNPLDNQRVNSRAATFGVTNDDEALAQQPSQATNIGSKTIMSTLNESQMTKLLQEEVDRLTTEIAEAKANAQIEEEKTQARAVADAWNKAVDRTRWDSNQQKTNQ